MRTALLLCLLAVLPGCLTFTPDSTSMTVTGSTSGPSQPPNPPSVWTIGQTLEATACQGLFMKTYGDRQAVQAAIPQRFQIPGSGPIGLFIAAYQCASATIGNGHLAQNPYFFFAYLDFHNDTADGSQGYLLEFSSSWQLPLRVLQSKGVPGDEIAVKVSAPPGTEQYDVLGNGTSYSFSLVPIPYLQNQPPQVDYSFFAGKEGDVRLAFHDPRTQTDQFPTACNATFAAGPLRALEPLSVCQAWHGHTTLTFELQSLGL